MTTHPQTLNTGNTDATVDTARGGGFTATLPKIRALDFVVDTQLPLFTAEVTQGAHRLDFLRFWEGGPVVMAAQRGIY